MMTDLDLTRLEALAEKATPGPWAFHAGDLWLNASADELDRSNEDEEFANELWYGDRPSPSQVFGGDPERVEDAEFIAAMRNAAPSLLAAARAVQRVEAALDLLASDTPGEMLILPPEHHACEREITRLAVVALRAALGGAE